jgi:hypothetical protein
MPGRASPHDECLSVYFMWARAQPARRGEKPRPTCYERDVESASASPFHGRGFETVFKPLHSKEGEDSFDLIENWMQRIVKCSYKR